MYLWCMLVLRYRALVPFLRRHGADLFAEVRAAYVDTLSRVLSSHFRAYLAALDAAKVHRNDQTGLYIGDCVITSCCAAASVQCKADEQPVYYLLPSGKANLTRCQPFLASLSASSDTN